jgi:hypothetical protein
MLNRIRARLTYANVTATLALFLALGLGTAWAIENNSVKSKHIKDGEVKPQDLADSSQAYAYVTADAGITESRGVLDVEQPLTNIGIYCFDLSFEPKVAIASTDSAAGNSASVVFAKTSAPGEDGVCQPDESDASVRIMNVPGPGNQEAPFYVIFE